MNTQNPDLYVSEAVKNGVLTLRLGRGPAHALSLGLVRALADTLERAAQAPEVRAILLWGEGRIFCAGHDLKEIRRHRDDADEGRAFVETLFPECSAMMLRLSRMPQPTIALVEGIATAGGLQLMASCDMAFATPKARFCLPGVRNGGFCTTPSVAVARKLARNHLAEMAFSGETFDADWALRTGLINRVYPAERLYDEAHRFAEHLATAHAPAVAAGKAMLYRQLELPLEQAYDAATPVMIDHFMDPARIAQEKAEWS